MTGLAAIGGLALLLIRPGMLVIVTPILGGVTAPAKLRIGLTVVLAIVLAPLVTVPAVTSIAELTIITFREVAIGLALALAIRLIVFGAEFAGHFTGVQVGLSLGSLIDPQTGVRNNIIALLYGSVAVLVCFALNVHHALLRALADSYAALPMGLGGIGDSLPGAVAQMLGMVFVLGVRIAAPVVVVLFLVELSLGLLARVAPALNVMIAGLPVRMAVGLLIVAVTVTLLPSILGRSATAALELAARTAGAFR